MSEIYSNIGENQSIVGQADLTGEDGKRIVVELVRNSDTSVALTHHFIDEDDVSTKSTSYGYCEGVYIGSVDCPNNDAYLDCVNKTISCRS